MNTYLRFYFLAINAEASNMLKLTPRKHKNHKCVTIRNAEGTLQVDAKTDPFIR